MTSEERTWLLISRAVSGDISPEEHKELEIVFLMQPELRSDYEHIKKLKLTYPSDLLMGERRAMDRGLERFDNSLADERRFIERHLFSNQQVKPLNRKSNKGWMVAASIITPLLISVYALYHFRSPHTPQQQELITHYGKRIHTILPDGSTVWLNSGSSIKYAENLITNGKREVTLNGEAYFDVKHDAKHPFIVHAGKLNIVVLGTAFNVKAYAGDAYMETTLIRGKVEISNDAKPGADIVLYPNEKATVNTSAYTVKKTTLLVKRAVSDSLAVTTEKDAKLPEMPDDAIAETAWVSNELTFKRENFTDLAEQLERWYNVKIVFDNNAYMSKQFTGTFKDQDINEVMHALQLTQSFHYEITNNQIHIW
jgi:transmembrane sensor